MIFPDDCLIGKELMTLMLLRGTQMGCHWLCLFPGVNTTSTGRDELAEGSQELTDGAGLALGMLQVIPWES